MVIHSYDSWWLYWIIISWIGIPLILDAKHPKRWNVGLSSQPSDLWRALLQCKKFLRFNCIAEPCRQAAFIFCTPEGFVVWTIFSHNSHRNATPGKQRGFNALCGFAYNIVWPNTRTFLNRGDVMMFVHHDIVTSCE